MKIHDIIESLKTLEKAELFAAEHLPGIDYWAIGLYMEEAVHKDAEIVLLDGESNRWAAIELNGKKYVNYFQLEEAQQLVQDFVNQYGPSFDNQALADRLYHYWEFDA